MPDSLDIATQSMISPGGSSERLLVANGLSGMTILDASDIRQPPLARHSADEAEAAMRVHLSEILTSLPRLAQAHPELFTD